MVKTVKLRGRFVCTNESNVGKYSYYYYYYSSIHPSIHSVVDEKIAISHFKKILYY